MGTEERRRRPCWEQRYEGDAGVAKGRWGTMHDIIERLQHAKEFSLLILIPGARGNPLYKGSNLLISVSGHLVFQLPSQPPCSRPQNTTRLLQQLPVHSPISAVNAISLLPPGLIATPRLPEYTNLSFRPEGFLASSTRTLCPATGSRQYGHSLLHCTRKTTLRSNLDPLTLPGDLPNPSYIVDIDPPR